MAKGKEQTDVVRLPLHRAALFFVPEFTENFDDWKRGLEAILDQFDWGPKVTVEPLEDEIGIVVAYRQITVSLFRGSGQLSVQFCPRYRLSEDFIPRFSCAGMPNQVRTEIRRFLRTRPFRTRQHAIERDILEMVALAISEVQESLGLNLGQALERGSTRLEARIDQPAAEYQEISSLRHFKAAVQCECTPFDTCDHFDVYDERHPPEGRPPQRLYDVHVAVKAAPQFENVPAGKPGRTKRWDPSVVEHAVVELFEHNGPLSHEDPGWHCQADVIRALEPIYRKHFDGVPSAGTLKTAAKEFISRFNKPRGHLVN